MTRARRGALLTAHGEVRTPAFMPVGTQGSVKAMRPEELRSLGAQIILGNTYHLNLRPGPELIRGIGGLHKFIGWTGSILTDSGGFQLYSMSGRHKVTEEGVAFSSHIDGSRFFISPEDCVRIQHDLGSDIVMALDHVLPYPSSRALAGDAMRLTCRWAARGRAVHAQRNSDSALFAIQQGGFDPQLRRECADRLTPLEFDGFAVGGLSVGEPKDLLLRTAELCSVMLPPDKPRYVMGVGPPDDLLNLIAMGYDMFDCVLPTRNARTGALFTSRGRLIIKHARYREDLEPIDSECGCPVCATFSRAYLRHLFISGEILASMLMTQHNLHFFIDLMRMAREAISEGRFEAFRREFLDKFGSQPQEF